jgi:enediyne biosynthesis protein E7
MVSSVGTERQRTVQKAEGLWDAAQLNDDSFLAALVRAERSREEIKYDILNIVLAGKGTMTAFLSSIWYVVSQRPDIYEKLRAEIAVLGDQTPTKEDLHRLPYLQKVLQEGIHSKAPPSTPIPCIA